MKRIKVLIPFNYNGETLQANTEHEIPEDVIERALKINVNMLLVLGDAKPKAEAKPKTKTK